MWSYILNRIYQIDIIRLNFVWIQNSFCPYDLIGFWLLLLIHLVSLFLPCIPHCLLLLFKTQDSVYSFSKFLPFLVLSLLFLSTFVILVSIEMIEYKKRKENFVQLLKSLYSENSQRMLKHPNKHIHEKREKIQPCKRRQHFLISTNFDPKLINIMLLWQVMDSWFVSCACVWLHYLFIYFFLVVITLSI
jgi:hypothetical protein